MDRGKPYNSKGDALQGAIRINRMLGRWKVEGFSICSIYPHGNKWYVSRYYRPDGMRLLDIHQKMYI